MANVRNDSQMVRVLLRFGAELNSPGLYGVVCLIAACDHEHTEVVGLLLEANVDANECSARGRTALRCAVCRGRTEIVVLLYLGPAPSRTWLILTARRIALVRGHTELAYLLL